LLFGGGAWWLLLGLALGKIVVTALTFGMGGSGGVFTPALYVGAAAGGAFGVAAAGFFPDVVAHPQAYALVGMGALVVATLEAPLTGILLVFEITGDYAIVLPLMLTAGVAHVVARRLQPLSLYGVWLDRRGEALTGGRDATLLGTLTVADAFDPDPPVIGQAATVAQLLDHLQPGAGTHFPVVDDALRPIGMVGVTELGRLARDEADLAPILLAADVANPIEPVHPGDSLMEALRRMGARGISTLPVTDPATGRLVGVIDRGHLLAAYEAALAGDGGPDRPASRAKRRRRTPPRPPTSSAGVAPGPGPP
jgi:CIC family chloride channel protein